MNKKKILKQIKKDLIDFLKKWNYDDKVWPMGKIFDTEGTMDKLFTDGEEYVKNFLRMATLHFDRELEQRSLLRKCLQRDDEAEGESEYAFEIKIEKIFTKGDPYDRVVDYLIQELEYEENKALRTVLEKEMQDENKISGEEFNRNASEALRYKIEGMRLPVDKFVISRDVLTDIVKHMAKVIDPIIQRELILCGYLGNYDNTMIMTTSGFTSIEALEPGEVYGLANSQYLGIIKFTEKLANVLEPWGKDTFKWSWSETIKIGIINPRGIAKWERYNGRTNK